MTSAAHLRNYRGQNLQGKSFVGQDLSNEDFTEADIRGANFTGANLTSANFSQAIAGISYKNWAVLFVIIALIGAIGAICLLSTNLIFKFFAEVNLFHVITIEKGYGDDKQSIPLWVAISIGIILLTIHALVLNTLIRNGLNVGLRKIGLTVSIILPTFALLGAIGNANDPIRNFLRAFRLSAILNPDMSTEPETYLSRSVQLIGKVISFSINNGVVVTGAVMISLFACVVALILAKLIGGNKLKFLALFELVAITTITSGLVTKNAIRTQVGITSDGDYHPAWIKDKDIPFVEIKEIIKPEGWIIITLAVLVAIAFVFIYYQFANQVLAEIESNQNQLFYQTIVFILSSFGTNFTGANLTLTNFSHASLTATNFRAANTRRTLWYAARDLQWAEMGETILKDRAIRQLLVTRNGANQSYINANLQGANLTDSNLNYANLKGADLTDATLEASYLDYANFSEVQAIGADFNNAKMTGVCGLATWNIDSTTNLEWVDSRWVYLLEYPKLGTDDRERKPASGEFAVGEFTKIFQTVTNTVDLIFRDGFQADAFAKSFQKIQIENSDENLEVQGIENRDGVVIVRVKVKETANKEKIYSDFFVAYEEEKLALETRLNQLERIAQENQAQIQLIQGLTTTFTLEEKVVIIRFGRGDICQGFDEINIQCWFDHNFLPTSFLGKLPPQVDLLKTFQQWQNQYDLLTEHYKIPTRIKQKSSITNFAVNEIPQMKQKLRELEISLQQQLNNWLNSLEFAGAKNRLLTRLNPTDKIRLLMTADAPEIHQMPWVLWDFFHAYNQAEVAVSLASGERASRAPQRLLNPGNKVRILAILGESKDLNIERDQRLLSSLSSAEIEYLYSPNMTDLINCLWDDKGWDILCFSGHSQSKADGSGGHFMWSDPEGHAVKISIDDLAKSLTKAIDQGLKLAIFNSCDGLGLARRLAELNLPQSIVMRAPIPDQVAQDFFQHFLTAFSGGKSLYLSVRSAREKLESWQDKFPCVTSLPVICQNSAEVPLTWKELGGN